MEEISDITDNSTSYDIIVKVKFWIQNSNYHIDILHESD